MIVSQVWGMNGTNVWWAQDQKRPWRYLPLFEIYKDTTCRGTDYPTFYNIVVDNEERTMKVGILDMEGGWLEFGSPLHTWAKHPISGAPLFMSISRLNISISGLHRLGFWKIPQWNGTSSHADQLYPWSIAWSRFFHYSGPKFLTDIFRKSPPCSLRCPSL